MDADELSAYAENSLPAAARARYAAHLADCDNCRRIVTGIALASNGALEPAREIDTDARLASAAAPVSAGWRARLAALFAPRTLGYALPALALCVFAVVAFVALRSTPDERTQMARHQPASPPDTAVNTNAAEAAATTETTATTNMTGETPLANTNTSTATTSAQASSDADASGGPQSAPAPKTGAAGESGGGNVQPNTQNAPATLGAATTSGQRQDTSNNFNVSTARPVQSAPPPASMEPSRNPTEASAEARSTTEFATERKRAADEADSVAAPRREMSKQRNDAAGTQMEDGEQMSRRSRSAGAARSSQSRRSGEAESAPEDAPGYGAVRSVAGHRFRREGGAWVDLRYDEGIRTISVRRGTEQFRALAADIPELERIANQIAGEVIVVIRDRAYRIR